MDVGVAATLSGAIGLVIGAAAVGATKWSEWSQRRPDEPSEASLPRGVGDVLTILRGISVVLDSSDAVVNTSPAATSFGLVRRGELVHQELRHLARQVRRDGAIREVELNLSRAPATGLTTAATSDAGVVMRVRVAPLGVSHVLILAEDHTQARRLEEVRRDFVANVSHELKTPVGGISLLAEAVLDARDDPVAVSRFSQRILVESSRLGRLVQEIVDLSRLQVADTLHEPALVSIDAVVAEALDLVRVAAEAKAIDIGVVVDPDLFVYGDADLLVTALANLLSNAVNYSDEDTRVGVGGRLVDDMVELTVTDQGRGIAPADQERIFERFYRVDAARSRATGGTGLGLAIVKHICANHGGEVTVWSEIGHGSTFTMRLPAATDVPTLDIDQESSPTTNPREESTA